MLTFEVIYYGTMKKYLRHGELHRKYSPAAMWIDGGMGWFEYDEDHRKEGPSMIFQDGTEYYWLRGNNHFKKYKK